MNRFFYSNRRHQTAVCGLAVLALISSHATAFTLPLRVNCGGGDITDGKTGVKWLSDKRYVVDGEKYLFKGEPKKLRMEGLAPAKVYQSVRRGGVKYVFGDLPDGIYRLRLHFMDGKAASNKQPRAMDFWLEDLRLIHNLDVRLEAGGTHIPHILEFIVQVKDGNGLELRGSRGKGDDAFINAIEILAAPPGSVPAAALDLSPHPPADMAGQLRRFAGGPVRLVWARATRTGDFYQMKATGQLYGYDTEDGKGERCILPEVRSYAKPLLTPDGSHVVFTDYVNGRCFEVAFDGTGLRELVPGYASDVWQDPASKMAWVYVRTICRDPAGPIRRYRLNDVTQSELVWDATPTGQDQTTYFQVSADGLRAVDGFPWPQMGLADVAARDFKVIGGGCWPSIAPDQSQRMFYFRGVHTAIQFFDEPGAASRTINLATIPGWKGRKLYHPRWSSHVRFMTATAPQWVPETELYLGKFDEGFTKIESWFRITYNDTEDCFGDALIGLANKDQSAPQPATPALVVAPHGVHVPGLVFVWENGRAKNAIIGKDGNIVRAWSCAYTGESRPNRWFGADLRAGSLMADRDAGEVVSKAVSASGELTVAMDLTPHSTKPGAEGVVAALGSAEPAAQMMVEQRGGALQVTINTGDGTEARAVKLADMSDTKIGQWVVTVQGGILRGYMNGKPVMEQPLAGTLAGWNAKLLTFGSDCGGKRPWRGSLEGIAIYDRALTAQDVASLHTERSARWAQRQPAPRVEVEAELIAASKPADPKVIAPYVRSLVENHYRVKKILGGTLKDADVIILQWAILGGKELPGAQREAGKVLRLSIEPVESHPELDGEHRSSDVFEPSLPVYYDIDS